MFKQFQLKSSSWNYQQLTLFVELFSFASLKLKPDTLIIFDLNSKFTFILETFISENHDKWAVKSANYNSHDLIQLASDYWKLIATVVSVFKINKRYMPQIFHWPAVIRSREERKLSLISIERGLNLYQSDWISLDFFYDMIFGWLIKQTWQTMFEIPS